MKVKPINASVKLCFRDLAVRSTPGSVILAAEHSVIAPESKAFIPIFRETAAEVRILARAMISN